MPFTPFHFGPALFIGVLLFPYIDFATIMIASVILDLEPLAVIIFDMQMPLHAFFHTYLGATIVAILLSFGIYPLRKYFNELVSFFGLKQKSSFRHILPASIIGTYSHVFLDSFLYIEMNPFFPIIGNPFVDLIAGGLVYNLCFSLGFLGFFVYLLRILLNLRVNKIEGDAFE
ncbi:MAG: hypothetical protein AM326_06010 [Candidatus Thorarchaeota archaeon SMTZ-45]|nr:MAG: hypothetical protein AM325_05775 [Candidatus Thorarchaeota archaeon SMTZ1-45]KXH76986.1 MAG: hypothetical protein AM326_06010 [Candidatus Thorarchaeota archaeon SMTZ-45]